LAKVSIENAALVARKVNEIFDDLLEDKKFLKKVGNVVVKDIKAQARLGELKLPALANSTRRSRDYLAQFNTTSRFYAVDKSNVTFTGQLIDSIKSKIVDGKIVISPTGSREPYITASGVFKVGPDNKEVGSFLKKKGFEFLVVTKETKDKVSTQVLRQIRRAIRAFNKK